MKDLKTLFLLMFVMLAGLVSCDETAEPGEFDNWQVRNKEFVDSIATVARANADGTWKVILADGLDSSFDGELEPSFDVPVSFVLSGTVSGFSAALQKMVVGDTWRIYIPSTIGYGMSDINGVPAYSTLIFDVNLVSFCPRRYSGT